MSRFNGQLKLLINKLVIEYKKESLQSFYITVKVTVTGENENCQVMTMTMALTTTMTM